VGAGGAWLTGVAAGVGAAAGAGVDAGVAVTAGTTGVDTGAGLGTGFGFGFETGFGFTTGFGFGVAGAGLGVDGLTAARTGAVTRGVAVTLGRTVFETSTAVEAVRGWLGKW
jgi:hypothetical protein